MLRANLKLRLVSRFLVGFELFLLGVRDEGAVFPLGLCGNVVVELIGGNPSEACGWSRGGSLEGLPGVAGFKCFLHCSGTKFGDGLACPVLHSLGGYPLGEQQLCQVVVDLLSSEAACKKLIRVMDGGAVGKMPIVDALMGDGVPEICCYTEMGKSNGSAGPWGSVLKMVAVNNTLVIAVHEVANPGGQDVGSAVIEVWQAVPASDFSGALLTKLQGEQRPVLVEGKNSGKSVVLP